MNCIRAMYDIFGIVQGVGFRPSVYRVAHAEGLSGWVQNRSGCVRLCLIGDGRTVNEFIRRIETIAPRQARVDRVERIELHAVREDELGGAFRIVESTGTDALDVTIPSDLAICADCRDEIRDPGARRHNYAFTTCTNCGPRYTVVNAMPYDRERTTMVDFPLCEACRREYEDPTDRRFHAESLACPSCGPEVALLTDTGDPVAGDPLAHVRQRIAAGDIVAVKGIGGFLLTCDAHNPRTLARLRAAKKRPAKPFAVMARDVAVARTYCSIDSLAEQVLCSPEAPIVLLPRHAPVSDGPPDLLAPDVDTLGIMLPTSPLHFMLFGDPSDEDECSFDLLVMTSGNRGGEPICTSNEEAQERLAGIADCFLIHNRRINLRNDDSLVACHGGGPQVWRRARGYAPNAIRIASPIDPCVLAMGAELKSTVALGMGHDVVISPHIGDLETPEAIDGFDQIVACLPVFLRRDPRVIAVDLHPDMHSSRRGRAIACERGLSIHAVQHHHAHAASCLGEHGQEEGLALVFDGTGLGTDGTIWGAELLAVQAGRFRRLATFAGVPLPGGDAAVKKPGRQAAARILAAGLSVNDAMRDRFALDAEELAVLEHQCAKGINAPITHSAGRLFDAFSALLGLSPRRVSYEGQAAITCETAADRCRDGTCGKVVPFALSEEDGMLTVDWADAFRVMAAADCGGGERAAWALAFHEAVAAAAIAMVEYGFAHSPFRSVALSGGVFMNRRLTALAVDGLNTLGAEPLIHRAVPPNDGGISFGQAIIAGAAAHAL